MTHDPSLTKQINKSLDVSWKEGIPASVMLGITDYYVTPFGLFLGATTQQIGFLVAIPQLLASISQVFAAHFVRRVGSRLRFLVQMAFFQAALLIPMALLSIIPLGYEINLLILLMIAFRVLGNLIATAWGSLVSDYLPPQKRGHYFGWRAQVVGIAAFGSVALAGIILYFMKSINPGLGFLIIFLGAALCRFSSVWLLTKMVDLPLHHSPEFDFSFFDFMKRFRESNFVKFVLYVGSITFATFISAPYISVFILRDIRLDYLSYMAIQISSVISSLIAFPIWGKHADLVGNARILKTTSLIIPVIPILWILSPLFSYHLAYLMLIEMCAGFVWGGFNLCATNFIYDAVSPEKRVRCLGYFNLINGTCLFAGATIGGFLATILPPLWGWSLLSLFLLSSLLRAAAHFLVSGQFKEVRDSTRKISSLRLFFSVVGIRPLEGLNREWNFFPPSGE